MSNYTGPVLLIPFVGPKDSFVLTLHSNAEDTTSIERIVQRYAEDGYKPDLKGVRHEYKVNGSLVHPDERRWSPPGGFRSRSAFLRS